jgi:hypothetical protein
MSEEPLYHLARTICTVLLDPRDSLLHPERTQGFAADPVYVKGKVVAYGGLSQSLKDLKDLNPSAWDDKAVTVFVDCLGIKY